MSRIYLGLGTNLGDTESNLEQALYCLSEKITILKKSSLYETEPVGFKDQPWFLNMVVEAETDLSPNGLLRFVQSTEKRMKRVKTIVNGPRIIDIDILLYDDERVDAEGLIIPHPRMTERAFVMVPLREISPGLVISGKSISDIMSGFSGERIRKV
ncbi:MAG: 2-amino-4-hydroxy-6-hydroxymethyldihydropteridine diphosphokinase [Clostridiales Family XIII bacterium]|jgi:2-amino-4-hydroxy-6-hydroxymethyldihydropteridine diphosphokinase|nr:2-amino-4-hydroxy-6-hydroxymethyldihydropteridine diphosphokinase [Clostridiales Family XIII bacterium]